MRGRKSGKWNLSGNENELEEYFQALESEELDDDYLPQPSISGQETTGLSNAEEFRRLTAYVAHLREKVSGLEHPISPVSQPRSHSVGAIVGFAFLVGVGSGLGIIARRLSRFD